MDKLNKTSIQEAKEYEDTTKPIFTQSSFNSDFIEFVWIFPKQEETESWQFFANSGKTEAVIVN